jgi:hypothetical protein
MENKILDYILRFILGAFILIAVIFGNYLYWSWMLHNTSGIAIALFLLWLLLFSWTSFIGFLIAIVILFGEDLEWDD